MPTFLLYHGSLWMWPLQCWGEEKDHTLDLLVALILTQFRMLLAFLVARVHCWRSAWCPPKFKSFWEAAFRSQPPACTDAWKFSSFKCRISQFPLLSFLRFSFAIFSSLLSHTTWTVTRSCGVSTTPAKIWCLQTVRGCALTYVIKGDVKRHWSCYQPLGTALLMGFHMIFMSVITCLNI